LTAENIEQLYTGLADDDRKQLVSELVTSLGQDKRANVGGHPSRLAQVIEPEGLETAISLRKLMPKKDDVKLLVAGVGAASAGAVSDIVLQAIPQIRTMSIGNIAPSTLVQAVIGLIGYRYTHGLVQAGFGGVVIGAAASFVRSQGLYLKPKGVGTVSTAMTAVDTAAEVAI